MDIKNSKVIAFYLPQFHPIPENDSWWGKGFTEWTNVAKAKPLYKGHYQPKIPADLGFYDLRLPEIRKAQVELAKEAGVSAFCYWHYWFGNGKRILERPIEDMLNNKDDDFPFCLSWANHSWFKKNWNSDVSVFSQELLIEQTYPGKEDVDNHFYAMLPAFKDSRYFRLHDKLVFVIYSIDDLVDSEYFIDRWRSLAIENELPGFFFIGHTYKLENIDNGIYKKLDAINLHLLGNAFNESLSRRFISWLFKRPTNVVPYSSAINKLENNFLKKDRIFPTIYPNWDVSPRIGSIATILNDSTPELFKKHVKRILNLIAKKKKEDRVVFLKSWNEWAEGNYMEPDLKFGKGYIHALNEALKESSRS